MFLCVYADIDQSYFVASNNGGENFGHEQDLSVLWGLADEATVLGKLFYFPIPSDAFRGSVDSFEVRQFGSIITAIFVCYWNGFS